MDADERRLNEITEQIIGASFEVSNDRGCGFLERVYENAMMVELTLRGLKVQQQKRITIKYKNVVIGDYIADMIVEECVLTEIKHADGIADEHIAQCINYLKATEIKICLIINFGKPKVQIKRVVLDL